MLLKDPKLTNGVNFKICLFVDNISSFLDTGSSSCDFAGVSRLGVDIDWEGTSGNLFASILDNDTVLPRHGWSIHTRVCEKTIVVGIYFTLKMQFNSDLMCKYQTILESAILLALIDYGI